MIDWNLIRRNFVDFRSKERAHNGGEHIIEVAYDILGICRIRINGNPTTSCHVRSRTANRSFQGGVAHRRARCFAPRLTSARPLPAITVTGRHPRLGGIIFFQFRAQLRFKEHQTFFTGFAHIAGERFQIAADRGDFYTPLPQQFIFAWSGERANGFGNFDSRVQSLGHGAQDARQRRFHGFLSA
jgi:hypothetical protein